MATGKDKAKDHTHEAIFQAFKGGLSMAEIAAKFPPLTRNAVAGIIYRQREKENGTKLNTAQRSARISTRSMPEGEKVKRRAVIEAPPVACVTEPKVAAGLIMTFDDVITHDTCRWIDGDRKLGTDRYCANQRMDGKPWCSAHHRRTISKQEVPKVEQRTGL